MSNPEQPNKIDNQGEGNKSADRNYREAAKKFVDKNDPDQIKGDEGMENEGAPQQKRPEKPVSKH